MPVLDYRYPCTCAWGGPGPCPCPNYREYTRPVAPAWMPQPVAPAHGCICPPGAEATCKGDLCPRRDRKGGAA